MTDTNTRIDTNDTNKKILHKDLSYQLNGLFFETHNKLGRFLKEKQYADFIENLLKEKSIKYKREFTLTDVVNNVERNRVDFLVEDKIIIDIKAKKILTKEDYYQMLRYLKVSDLKLGLVVNFRNSYLKPKRIINL